MRSLNGCTCAMTRAGAKGPMPPGWLCTACRARSKADRRCRECGVGLLKGADEIFNEPSEHDRGTCTECHYE